MRKTEIEYIDRDSVRGLMPVRPAESNKYTFGRVLCVCGNVGMSGAAYLSAYAAYRSGCGLVDIMTHEDNRVILQTLLPEAVTSCYGNDGAINKDSVKRADTVVIGCGLGNSELSEKILRQVLSVTDAPLVIDADALNIMANNPDLWDLIHTPTVITPHTAEMARISGIDIEKIENDRVITAVRFAKDKKVVCLLKGHRSVITDGDCVFINKYGNSGMATGGSGDVLSGIMGAIGAQRVKRGAHDLLETAALAAAIHSLAGDSAAEELGEYSLMAVDIINHIHKII